MPINNDFLYHIPHSDQSRIESLPVKEEISKQCYINREISRNFIWSKKSRGAKFITVSQKNAIFVLERKKSFCINNLLISFFV